MAEVTKRDVTGYTKFLPNQYVNSTTLNTFLRVFLDQIQELEDANLELDKYSTDIALAFGYQLDIIGKLIGVDRKGRSDEEYRDAIYFQISLNTGSGTPEDAIQYLSYVTQASKVRYWEHYPASIIMETNGTEIPTNIPNTLDNITLAGVSVGGVIVSETGEVFRGCDETEAFSNYETVENLYPELEMGAALMECGAETAECVYETFIGFKPVEDSDQLARCIFPDIDLVGLITFNGAGEEIMAAGEEEAEASNPSVLPQTTKGVFAEVYVKI